MTLCDTNIFIELFRENKLIRSELEKIGLGNIVLSDVVKAELLVGARNKLELNSIRRYLNTLPTLHITANESAMAVSLVDAYSLSHKLLLPDALIAATALQHHVELFTLNAKDFKFIPNIKLYHF
jgi:predicted nucleic acid-binding protein